MPQLRAALVTLVLALAPAVAAAQAPSPPAEAPPAEAPPAPPAKADVTVAAKYDKGFTFATSDDQFALKIVGRLQGRWELFRQGVGDDAEDELTHRFSIARARVTLEGKAFGGTHYKFQTDFGKGFVLMRDFYLDQKVGGFQLRVGQWKKPYSRQQITSSGSLQLVDRSTTDKFGAAGRDIGVAIHNNYEKSPEGIEWALGVFNGTGDGAKIKCTSDTNVTIDVTDPTMPVGTATTDTTCGIPTNVPSDIGPVVVARVGYNKGKIKGYSESDLEGGPLRLAAAVSYMGDLAEGEGDAMSHRVAADFILKANGASLTGGAYVFNRKLPNAMGELEGKTDFGFFGQGGYMLKPKKMELAARFSMIPDANVADENQLEVLGGFNWFAHGHSFKWQTDAGILKTTSVDGTEVVVRSQVQLIF